MCIEFGKEKKEEEEQGEDLCESIEETILIKRITADNLLILEEECFLSDETNETSLHNYSSVKEYKDDEGWEYTIVTEMDNDLENQHVSITSHSLIDRTENMYISSSNTEDNNSVASEELYFEKSDNCFMYYVVYLCYFRCCFKGKRM